MSFLELPLELRLIIYGYAAIEGSAVTISAARLNGSGPDLIERQYGGKRTALTGLPALYEPVILSRYSSRLLSVSRPAQLNLKHGGATPRPSGHSTFGSLLLLNQQIHDEVSVYFDKKSAPKTSCFVSYPLGLHVLSKNGPDLLRQARSIHIAGSFTLSPPESSSSTLTNAETSRELLSLIRATLDKECRYPISKFEARIYFPGGDSYSSVWADESPITTILHNVASGYVDMEILRGRNGSAAYISVKPHPEGKRCVSTVWRQLHEGGHDQPDCGQWAVDKKWPKWNEDYVASPPSPAW